MNLLDKIRYLMAHGYSITFVNAPYENICINVKKCSFNMIQYVSKEAPEEVFIACLDNLDKEISNKERALNMFVELSSHLTLEERTDI